MSLDLATLKAWLHLRQNGRCLLCGEALDLSISRGAYGSVTFEHVLPKLLGGAKGRSNLALSHKECNHWRGSRRLLRCVRPAWLESVSERGRRPLVPMCGIWFSHFRLPIGDRRWGRP